MDFGIDGTSKQEISAWFDMGVKDGYTHMLVICDTFDYEDYPTYAKSKEEAVALEKTPGSMQRVMEVYILDPARKDSQLNEFRARNFD